jgi:hypothetical protein
LLDTLLLGLIRFRQKVLMDLPPLELFSLEEKAAHVAGWPFRFGTTLGVLKTSSRFSILSEKKKRDCF